MASKRGGSLAGLVIEQLNLFSELMAVERAMFSAVQAVAESAADAVLRESEQEPLNIPESTTIEPDNSTLARFASADHGLEGWQLVEFQAETTLKCELRAKVMEYTHAWWEKSGNPQMKLAMPDEVREIKISVLTKLRCVEPEMTLLIDRTTTKIPFDPGVLASVIATLQNLSPLITPLSVATLSRVASTWLKQIVRLAASVAVTGEAERDFVDSDYSEKLPKELVAFHCKKSVDWLAGKIRDGGIRVHPDAGERDRNVRFHGDDLPKSLKSIPVRKRLLEEFRQNKKKVKPT